MKKLIFIINLVLLTSYSVQAQEDFRRFAPPAAPAPKIQIGTYQEFTLANGLRVIVVENHKLPQVSFQVFVDVPPLKEGDYAGTASIAGQLLKSGTKTKTKAQIDQSVDFIGASLSTSASGVSGSSLTRHREKLLALMADVLLNPSFPAAEFDKIKKQTLSGLAYSKEDPNTIASNVAQVLRYGKNHPYGELTTETTVENVTLDRVKKYYQTYFKPNISYFIVTGDIKPAEAKLLAEKYFGKWLKAEVKRDAVALPAQPDSVKVAFVNKTGAVQSIINITYPVNLKPGPPDAIRARLANSILGAGSFGSRLFQNIREDKGYSYGAYSSLSPDPHVGSFSAGAAVRNEVTDSAITQFLYEMKRLQDEKVSDAELTQFKNIITGGFARSLEEPGTIAQFALNTARYKLPKDYYATYLQKLSSVSADDVMTMAKQFITPEKAYIIVVGDKNAVADKLKPFDANGEIDYYDNYGNKIQVMSSAADMTAEKVIDRYVEAIGGKEKLAAVNDVTMKMTASVQGMSLETIYRQKAPNKLYTSTTMNGMVMQEQKFDGTNGVAAQMGQKQKLEGKDLESLKTQAVLFSEAKYQEM
ncbi:MAG: M16 family metallopeptidase, partial [Saprospiraceae bacterium]